jgi:hypothetical protein
MLSDEKILTNARQGSPTPVDVQSVTHPADGSPEAVSLRLSEELLQQQMKVVHAVLPLHGVAASVV